MGCADSKPLTQEYHHSNGYPVMGAPVYSATYPPPAVLPSSASGIPKPSAPGGAQHAHAHHTKFYEAGVHDIHLLIDDSSSMRPTWGEAKEGVEALLIEACKYDDDGVNVSFLNHHETYLVRTVDEVIRVFNAVMPVGTTPTAEALRRITDPYWANFNPKAPKKPMSVVVVTDGAPNDPRAVEGVIVDSARRLMHMGAPKGQLGFTFVGIGIHRGSKAYRHLMDLDQTLPARYQIPDIADCASLDEDDGSPLKHRLLKCLFGGVDAHLDAMHE